MTTLKQYGDPQKWADRNWRKLELLQLRADGYTNDEIAEMLYLETGSVANVFNSTYKQLEARNGAHAVAIAMRAGLIE